MKYVKLCWNIIHTQELLAFATLLINHILVNLLIFVSPLDYDPFVVICHLFVSRVSGRYGVLNHTCQPITNHHHQQGSHEKYCTIITMKVMP